MRIYLVSETGETVVLAAENPPWVLARSSVGERSVATPAISEGLFLLRSERHLIAIGGNKGGNKED